MPAAPTEIYRPRRAGSSPLIRLLQHHFAAFHACYEERLAPTCGDWRPVVREVAEKFLACGILASGVARVRCEAAGCGHEYLVAFSCKARYFCPSCHAKRLRAWCLYRRRLQPAHWRCASLTSAHQQPTALRLKSLPYSIAIADRGLQVVCPNAVSRVSCAAVRSVATTPTHVIVYPGPMRAIVVARAAVADGNFDVFAAKKRAQRTRRSWRPVQATRFAPRAARSRLNRSPSCGTRRISAAPVCQPRFP